MKNFIKKQIGFREEHTTKHELIQLIDQIKISFEKIILLLVSFLTFQKNLTPFIITF